MTSKALTTFFIILSAFASVCHANSYLKSTNNACKIQPTTTKITNRANWQGDCKDGYAHGQGTAYWYTGDKLRYHTVGTFIKGRLTGDFISIADDNTLPVHHIQGTSNHGELTHAKIIFGNGEIYEGDFANGQFHGKGRYAFTEPPFAGDRYEGDFVNGKHHGFGTYWYNNDPYKGDRYEGQWVNHQRHGKGKYYHADGEIYEGDFVNGQFHGKGKKIWQDGSSYEGDWQDSLMHGKGELITADGSVSVGDFWLGMMTGHTTQTRTNGVVYAGRVINGRAFGFGVLTTPKSAYDDDVRSPLGHWQGDDYVEQGWFFAGRLAFVCQSDTHCRQVAKNKPKWQGMIDDVDDMSAH